MIDAHDVDPELAHLREIAVRLLLGAKIIAVRIRLERPVGDALDEKLPVALEEEFRESTDADRAKSELTRELFLVQRSERTQRLLRGRAA